jgi:hypothetical protein
MSDLTRDPVCAACQEALETGSLAEHVSLEQHLAGCPHCQVVAQEIEHIAALARAVALPEADAHTMQRTERAVTTILAAQRAAERRTLRRVLLRLVLVGLLVVPLIIAFNGALGYLIYWALGGLSATLTWILLGAVALLGAFVLSLYWGALPILTRLAVDLRRGAGHGSTEPPSTLSAPPLSGVLLQLV